MGTGLVDCFGHSADDERTYEGSYAQRERQRRYREYGEPVHGWCWHCEAAGLPYEGEVWQYGGIKLCGDHRDAVENAVGMRMLQGMVMYAE